MTVTRGIVIPKARAMEKLITPETSPLTAAIWMGSADETFLVRLLSMAQARQAPAMKIVPHGMPISGLPTHDSRTPPATIAAIPKAMRRSKFSLKTNHASKAVNTPSRFNNSEAEDAGVSRSPMSKRIGPRIPPARIALPSQGKSCRFKRASLDLPADLERRHQSQTESPMPDPR